jgi:hypothetical protein
MHLLCVSVCMQLQQVGMGATPCALTIILTLHATRMIDIPFLDRSWCPELNFLFSTHARYQKRSASFCVEGDAHTPQPHPLGASFLTLSEQQSIKKDRKVRIFFFIWPTSFFPLYPRHSRRPQRTVPYLHPLLLQPLAASQNTLDHRTQGRQLGKPQFVYL